MVGAAGAHSIETNERGVAKIIRSIDWPLLLITLTLVAYGLVVVYSASLSIAEASLRRQATGAAIGLVALVVAWRFDYRQFEGMTKALLIIDCLLMVLPVIPFLRYTSHGISGWIQVPFLGITMQTAELAKPVTILLMASLGVRFNGRIDTFRDYAKLCLILALPFMLILLQPDLGTGLVVLFSGAIVIVVAGARRSWIALTLLALAALVALVLGSDGVVDQVVGDANSLIKDYQMNRLLVFLNPELDTSGSSYNLQQSLIAVGSGGLLGKGIGNATQAMNGFLPEAHTDFAFALLSEEFGFVGSAALVLLFLALILQTIRIALRCDCLFGRLVATGIAAMWAFQIFENIGMCLSMMPITGIPLPFISYGSSSMVTQLLTVGLVLSVHAHRSQPDS